MFIIDIIIKFQCQNIIIKKGNFEIFILKGGNLVFQFGNLAFPPYP